MELEERFMELSPILKVIANYFNLKFFTNFAQILYKT